MTVLSTAARLSDEFAFHIDFLGDRFLVGNLRCAHIGLHLELTQETVYDNLQVKLTHTGDDGLSRLRVGVGLKGGILLRQLRQRNAHLFLPRLGFRLNGDGDNGFREYHGLQNDGMLVVAQGVACGRHFQTDGCCDIAGVYFVELLSLIGVHLQDSTDSFLFVLRRVQYIGAGIDRSGVNPEECQLTDEGIHHDLEGQG